jgi:hypothetical protein
MNGLILKIDFENTYDKGEVVFPHADLQNERFF